MHIVNYTARYIYFINIVDENLLQYLNGIQVQCKVFSSLVANDFLLGDQVELNYWTVASCYIFGYTLEQHFALAIWKQKYDIDRKIMPKFFNWRKANVIRLPILPLSKASITKTIHILRCLVGRLELLSIVEDTVVPIKSDYLTIRNVTRVIY